MRAKRAITKQQISEIEDYIDKMRAMNGGEEERWDEARWELIKYQAELEGLRRRAPKSGSL